MPPPKPPGDSRDPSGQATVEFSVAIAGVSLVVVLTCGLSWKEWRRLVCVKNLFETTRRALMDPGDPPLRLLGSRGQASIRKTLHFVEGHALCEHTPETIRFYRLEPEP